MMLNFVCSIRDSSSTNDDPRLTIWLPMHLNGENYSQVIKWENIAANNHTDDILKTFEKKITSLGCLPLPWGYRQVYDH